MFDTDVQLDWDISWKKPSDLTFAYPNPHVTWIAISRPSKLEDADTVQLPKVRKSKLKQEIEDLLQSSNTIGVFALNYAENTAFYRGIFKLRKPHRKHIVLQRVDTTHTRLTRTQLAVAQQCFRDRFYDDGGALKSSCNACIQQDIEYCNHCICDGSCGGHRGFHTHPKPMFRPDGRQCRDCYNAVRRSRKKRKKDNDDDADVVQSSKKPNDRVLEVESNPPLSPIYLDLDLNAAPPKTPKTSKKGIQTSKGSSSSSLVQPFITSQNVVRSVPPPPSLTQSFFKVPSDSNHLQSSTLRPYQRQGYIQSIPTTYKGIDYRSKLEAETAQLMTRLGVKYTYETFKIKRGNSGRWYMPDFWLGEFNIALEIKPCFPHTEELQKCEEASRQGFHVVLLYGRPRTLALSHEQKGRYGRSYKHKFGMRGIAWKNGVRLPGDTMWVDGVHPDFPSPDDRADIHLDQVIYAGDTRWESPRIIEAMNFTM